MANVLYSAVVLIPQSRKKLIDYFKSIIPPDFEIIAHHMTINLGKIDKQFENELGREVELTIIDYAKNDKVIAVGVTGFPSKNKKPHITIAVNRKAGGKPMMSNDLENWQPIQFAIKLRGNVMEIMNIKL